MHVYMCEMMSKGLKEALTVLIVTYITHVEGVKRSLNSFTHNFLNIQLIFNPKKVLESWDSDLSNHTNAMYSEVVKSFQLMARLTCINIHSIWLVWLERSKCQLFKTFFRLKIGWILRKLWVKMLWALTAYFGGARGHFIQSTLTILFTWVRWVALLCIQYYVKATNTTFNSFDMSNMSNN